MIPQVQVDLTLPSKIAYENPRNHMMTMIPLFTRTGLITTRNKQKVLKINLNKQTNSIALPIREKHVRDIDREFVPGSRADARAYLRAMWA